MNMKIKTLMALGIVTVAGVASLTGCDKKQEVGKKTGAAVDTAVNKTTEAAVTAADKTTEAAVVVADKTTAAAKTTATAAKNAAVKTAEKTDEVISETGSAVTQK